MSHLDRQDVVIFGAGKIAEVIYDYFRQESDLRVAAFCVDDAYVQGDSFQGLPLVASSELAMRFPPDRYTVLMAIGYHECNALRQRKYEEIKASGYHFATFISRRAWVADSVRLGEGCIVLDHVSIEPRATVGANVALWSGVTVGHHSTLGDHGWLAAGATIGGNTTVGEGCFLGVNATIGHEVALGRRCLIGGGAWVAKDTGDGSVLIAEEARLFRLDVDRFLAFTKKL